MAEENAKIDLNFKKTLTAVTDDAAGEIRKLRVDPTTGRLKVSAIITAGSGIQSLNGLIATTQLFALGTIGTDVSIVSGTATHTFNFPSASAANRGLLTAADWAVFTAKQNALTFPLAIGLGGTGAATKATAFDALSPMSASGDLIVGGAAGTGGRLAIGGGNTVLHGGASTPAWSAVVEADITLTAGNTTNNAILGTHGFCPALSNLTTQFLRGDGAWAVPAGTTLPNAYLSESFAYVANTAHSIVHNFGTFPLVQAFDASGYQAVPYIVYQSDVNTTQITFSASATYTVILTLGSPQLTAYTSTSANYAMLAGDYLIEETGASKIVTLLTPVGRSGKTVIIKNSSTGVCDVQTAAGTIDGYADITLVAGDSLTVVSNGTIWLII